LPDLWKRPDAQARRFVLLGAGKTAMDAAIWLLSSGAPPDAIQWVMPRD
jgi:NADPH-dependent glutamate synthase beta subunit-like oxidoreductase